MKINHHLLHLCHPRNDDIATSFSERYPQFNASMYVVYNVVRCCRVAVSVSQLSAVGSFVYPCAAATKNIIFVLKFFNKKFTRVEEARVVLRHVSLSEIMLYVLPPPRAPNPPSPWDSILCPEGDDSSGSDRRTWVNNHSRRPPRIRLRSLQIVKKDVSQVFVCVLVSFG